MECSGKQGRHLSLGGSSWGTYFSHRWRKLTLSVCLFEGAIKWTSSTGWMDMPECASDENCSWWPFGMKTDGRWVCTDLTIWCAPRSDSGMHWTESLHPILCSFSPTRILSFFFSILVDLFQSSRWPPTILTDLSIFHSGQQRERCQCEGEIIHENQSNGFAGGGNWP